ncbi:MAG: hypothetical protein IKJ08_08245 [Alistipes sp.]|nr:hypothetical protein [Alistipes sp.]
MTAQVQRDFLVSHIVDRLTEYLILDNSIDIAEALKIIYQSKVYQQLQDEEGELYVQSPSYIYELLKKELN